MSEALLARDEAGESTVVTSVPTTSRSRLVPVLIFLGFALLGAAWAMAQPWDGAPDERAHMVRAVGVVSGQIAPDGWTAVGPVTQHVPSELKFDACFAFDPSKSAACLYDKQPIHGQMVNETTAAGRYQPLYYALVGWPLSWMPDNLGLTLSRLIGVLLSAGFVGFAALAVVRWVRRPLMLAGLLLAVTPEALSVIGEINPNGLEIASAVAMWAALIPLVFEDGPIDRRLVWLAGVAAAVLALVRPNGPLEVAEAAVAVLLFAGGTRLKRLFTSKKVWALIVGVGVAGVASGVWTLVLKANELLAVGGHNWTYAQALRVVIADRLPGYVEGMIGYFGYLDTELPATFYFVWLAVTGFIVLTAMVVGSRADRWRMILTVAVTFVPIAAGDVLTVHSLGMIMQGRYILPVSAGIVLMATHIISRSGAVSARHQRAAVGFVAGVVAFEQLWALMYAMIRFQHGLNSEIPLMNPLDGPWHPVIGSPATLALGVVGVAVLLVAVRTAKFTDATAIPTR
ncbi:DUF2142 domain-containing protein [Kutzneria buriramensis]|uniref:DUF2142 domain-containing protein n=1 Tax=Kutzneria buriramensis TaxID=1045776 RepID=UPI000E2806F9|nr:DUF2142 domain-containing protein [Kutzneria buriramensis]